jgi:hypothetical protein
MLVFDILQFSCVQPVVVGTVQPLATTGCWSGSDHVELVSDSLSGVQCRARAAFLCDVPVVLRLGVSM